VINAVSAKLTTAQISKLNVLVTGSQKEDPATVAQNWLRSQHLI
jgi:glycine betaine/choline ABC-type transport system substrate-binding protein